MGLGHHLVMVVEMAETAVALVEAVVAEALDICSMWLQGWEEYILDLGYRYPCDKACRNLFERQRGEGDQSARKDALVLRLFFFFSLSRRWYVFTKHLVTSQS